MRVRVAMVCVAALCLATSMSGVTAVGAATASSAAPGPPASLVEYPLPNPDAEAWDLAAGPDGNMWAPYNFASTIARITPAGGVSELAVPPLLIFPVITAGGDGNLWFLDLMNNNVDRMTPDGAVITPFHIPEGNGGPNDITLGPDGNVWFTEFQTGQVGFVTPVGAVTEFELGPDSHPEGITAGPDGNVWFTDPFKNTVNRITPSGVITSFNTPTGAQNAGPYKITAGPDGNVWYTKPDAGVIGRVTPSGVVTEFYLPTGTRPEDITAGPDGSLWFSDGRNNQIGRITTTGKVGLFTLATPNSNPRNITTGPDGRLWFTMQGPARIGAFVPFVPRPSRPDVRSIVPPDSTTKGGTTVLITGYDIGTATQVLFGDTPATSFHAVGPGQIEAVAPAHAAGQVDVTVVTPAGRTAPSEGSKFFYSSLRCGKVVTRSTSLGSDIGPCYHDGVVIKADNVTLDLNGKRIFGFSRPSDGHAAGVRLQGRTGVTVKNGTVAGFDAGIVVSGGASNTLTRLTVKDNIGPDDFTTQLGDGIFIEDSPGNQVVGNDISHNGIFDGVGIYGPQSNANIVADNVVEDTVGPSDTGPAGQGIIINGATAGETPTHIESSRVENNVVRNSASAGIANINVVRGSIVGNVVVGNGRTNSIGNGIGVSVGFVWKGPTAMLIQGNEVHGNGVDGIRLAKGATGNQVRDNNAADNNANPAVDTYEGSIRGFDLHDMNPHCATNVWIANIWGSGGYSPKCTAIGGSGPLPPAAAESADVSAAAAPHPSAWERFLDGGRR